MPQNNGASVPDRALVSDQASVPCLDPSGFDPSRFQPNSYEGKPRWMPKNKRRELDALVDACQSHIDGLTPYRRGVLLDAMLSVSPINCSWQHFRLADSFIWDVAQGIESQRAETLGSVHESPVGNADAPKGNPNAQ